MYHFLSGYTAKVAGTERGLGKEPQATFSACFGGPFLPRPAADLRIAAGREAAPPRRAGLAGEYRMGRRTLRRGRAHEAALHPRHAQRRPQRLAEGYGRWSATRSSASSVPKSCPGVPATFLDARGMWADKEAYDRAALDLAARFNKNFQKFSGVSREIAAAAPGM